MKIEIKKDNSTLVKQYLALFGSFTTTGKTQAEAKENMFIVLEWFTSNSNNPQTVIKQLPAVQRTIILERSFDGYSVIVSYQDDENGIQTNVSCYGRISHSEALQRLESHVSSYIVTV